MLPKVIKKSGLGHRRKLIPLSQGVTKLYSLIAVLLVLIPEWIAEWIITIENIEVHNELAPKSPIWQTLPELRLVEMTLRDLR